MHPAVYISDGFFEIYDACYRDTEARGYPKLYEDESEYEHQRESLRRIRYLLFASNITTDIKDNKLVRYYRERAGATPQNLRDAVFMKVIKEYAYQFGRRFSNNIPRSECDRSSYCYFTDSPFEDCEEESEKKGRIIVGRDFLKKEFFLKSSFPVLETDASLPEADRIKHPCSGIIIIDKYLFEDGGRGPKLPSLLSFIDRLIPTRLTNRFEVDIFTKNLQNNSQMESKFDIIRGHFGDRISLHVYAPMQLSESDRYVLTNYAVISIQHPFDRETSISSHFYPSTISVEFLKEAYKLWLSRLSLAKQWVDSCRPIGLIKTTWKTDGLPHRIYEF